MSTHTLFSLLPYDSSGRISPWIPAYHRSSAMSTATKHSNAWWSRYTSLQLTGVDDTLVNDGRHLSRKYNYNFIYIFLLNLSLCPLLWENWRMNMKAKLHWKSRGKIKNFSQVANKYNKNFSTQNILLINVVYIAQILRQSKLVTNNLI